ncbi:BZIP family transcription factor [Trichophyton interdigitale]|uniref:BZIP domain-containing protein n=1 Tax=Trichophyton interdigitale (strain MR816) TaxID=1215338 RepID=A0A059JFJ6_TRIIM|nr:BZIP family transcription factor [Trichophyton interdigitale]KAG5217977.1 BZIP family transcription factor [Trichophyton interdigitale]KAG8206184.1 BZIP family transcription factor [Trichophyton interdigitale]KDB26630.1 hypothetical protein H109_01571 [Trichophyton interdigitale MR816]
MAMFSVPSSNRSSFDILSTMSFQDVPHAPFPTTGLSAEDNPLLMGSLMMYPNYDEPGRKQPAGNSKDKENSTGSGQQKQKSVSTRVNLHKKGGRDTGAVSMSNETKKRGRPRVDCPDRTAAERRRTQIRLAQRAYRMRKETAISSLTQRVTELEANMQEMREAFLAFNDEAVKSGALSAYPRLAQQLERTTRRVMSLTPEISEGGKSPTSDLDELPAPTTATENASCIILNNPTDTYASDESCQNVPDKLGYFNTEPLPLKDGDDLLYMNTIPTDTTQFYGPTTNDAITSINIPSVSIPAFEGTGLSNCPIPSPCSSGGYLFSRDLPITYSHQESSFARRLHRRSLEYGYALLTNPGTRPERLTHKFRLTFYLTMRSHLHNSFTTLLQRTANEPLEFVEKPHFCLGGAGMHYPRRDGLGNNMFPPNMQSLDRVLGTLLSQMGESEKFSTVQEFIEKMGLGGTWFDCHDVEGYLKTKGIHLGSLSTFIEIPSSLVANSRKLLASNKLTQPLRSQPNAQNATSSIEASYPPLKHSSDYLGPSSSSSNMRPLGLDSQFLPPTPAIDQTVNISTVTHRPRTVILDVEKFTTQLASRSTCLGRAPGFRKQDVHAAINASICTPHS